MKKKLHSIHNSGQIEVKFNIVVRDRIILCPTFYLIGNTCYCSCC